MKNLLPLIFALPFCGCALFNARHMEKPKVELKSVEIQNADAKGAQLLFGVQVDNPNPYPLKVDSVQYIVELAGRKLADEEIEKASEVGAKATAVVFLPMRLQYADLFTSLGDFLRHDFATYRLKGSARVGFFNLPFDESGKFKIENGTIKHFKE